MMHYDDCSVIASIISTYGWPFVLYWQIEEIYYFEESDDYLRGMAGNSVEIQCKYGIHGHMDRLEKSYAETNFWVGFFFIGLNTARHLNLRTISNKNKSQ